MWNIDSVRRAVLAVAEAIDAYRVIPRALLGAYGALVGYVVYWYIGLKPYILEGCTSDVVKDCIVQVPTTQHAALVTTVVGAAAVVIGLYQNSGRQWNGFTPWKKKEESTDSEEA